MQKRWENVYADAKTLELINKFFQARKADLNFNGSTFPEVFVGHYGYPHVNLGLLAPPVHLDNVGQLSSASEWFKSGLNFEDIIRNRSSLIYSRFQSSVKYTSTKFLGNLQELSMSKNQTDVEVELEKKPKFEVQFDSRVSPLTNCAPLKKVVITENVKVERRVEYVVSDYDYKSVEGLVDLYKHGIHNEQLIKLLSSGLLGVKKNRRLVPTRWSITAVDDTLSKKMISDIQHYSWIDCYYVFSCEYLGNHYEFVFLPRQWSFEVMEVELKNGNIWHDFETVFGRKEYASSVTGGYYAVRLAVCEFLERIKKQASVIVMREVKPCYDVPLGVGILRESVRDCFNSKPLMFNSLNEALNNAGSRLSNKIEFFTSKSETLKANRIQTSLNRFI